MNPEDDPEAFAAAGMAWWNSMTPAERDRSLERAERILGRPASSADAWLVDGSDTGGDGPVPDLG